MKATLYFSSELTVSDMTNSLLIQLYLQKKHFEVVEFMNRVFPKVDHSANIARIVLVEYTIGSVVKSTFC